MRHKRLNGRVVAGHVAGLPAATPMTNWMQIVRPREENHRPRDSTSLMCTSGLDLRLCLLLLVHEQVVDPPPPGMRDMLR
jgi:hypothetical protein